jgi:putative ABC transport system substrate-binding protein
MKRREFIGLLGGAAAWPVAARAQPSDLPVIGLLGSVSPGPFESELKAFKQGLAETGFIEGQNVAIEYRWAENRLERLPALAGELVKRQVSLIAAAGGLPSARAAHNATSSIPILFTGAGDPIKLGLVKSLHRPGGNVTGVSFVAVALAPKRLEILRELLPTANKVAVLSAGQDPEESRLLQDAARMLKMELQLLTATSDSDIEVAFAAIKNGRADAVLIGTGSTFINRRALFVELAMRHSVPAIYARREYVVDGGLVAYAPPVTEAYRQVGRYAARILKGEKPADLPVQQPTKFELTINVKAARALGLEIPPTLLARADEVIE